MVSYKWTHVVLVLLFAARANGAHFLVQEGVDKCFTESLLTHQVLRASYKLLDKEMLEASTGEAGDDTAEAECKILVQDPERTVRKEHAVLLEKPSGDLVFTASTEGVHSVCLRCKHEGWTGQDIRWSIAFDVLEQPGLPGLGGDLRDAAPADKLAGAQEMLEDILYRLAAVHSENSYETDFEAQFSRKSQAVNTDVAAVKIVQVLLLAGCAAFQMQHLGKWLRRNHLLDCASCLPFRARPFG
mmetsp:Transcript_39044/g.71093  ORF Transcript_39044/g.71093 Transcript_39044/m.71093 type:complete len:243 (+) Transcript_39044:92-820(+)